MNNHQHNPYEDSSVFLRICKFVVCRSEFFDFKSQTGKCSKCKKTIAAPNIMGYLIWAPVIYMLFTNIPLLLVRLIPAWLSIAILLILLVIIVWVVPAVILATGKWEDISSDEITEDELIRLRTRECRDNLYDLLHSQKYWFSCIVFLCVLILTMYVHFNS